jgi:hypothetical protein
VRGGPDDLSGLVGVELIGVFGAVARLPWPT